MGKNILIVDDFDNTLFVNGYLLQKAGYNVLKASSAKDALAYFDADVSIDLVITDYNMPEMDGLEFVRTFKKNPAYINTPVFVLSSMAKEELKREAVEIGVSLWMRKPFMDDKLLGYIKRAID